MNILETIKSLRAAFEQAVQKFADYKVGELTVRIEGEPIVGAPVMLMDADGNPVDATGEHSIPSLGTVVVANGVIESITPEAVEVEAAEPEEAAAAVEEVAAVVEEIAPEAPAEAVAAISAEVVADIMAKVDAMMGEMVEMKAKLLASNEREKQMFEIVEQLAKLPSVKEEPKTIVGQFKKTEFDRIEKLSEAIKQLKNK
jgi:hypothetical protein